MMLYWSAIFLCITIVAAVFGFAGFAGVSAGIAQVLFFIFLTLFAVTLLARLFQGVR